MKLLFNKNAHIFKMMIIILSISFIHACNNIDNKKPFIPAIPNAPDAPSGLNATKVSSRQIDLSWQDNSDNEDGFKIERSLNGTTFTEIGKVTSGKTTYNSVGLNSDTTYHYRIRAYNLGGNSDYSNSDSAKTDPPAPSTAIIINHTAVDAFNNIPDTYLDAIKTMTIQYVGQSHGKQVPHGLVLLEQSNSKYSVQMDTNLANLNETGALKVLRSQRTAYNNWSGDSIGEEGYWAIEDARLATERTVDFCIDYGQTLKISLWCWCWDITNDNYCSNESNVKITFNDERRNAYLNAIYRFNNNADINQTIFIYHTSITDTNVSEGGWRVTRYNDDIRQAAIDNNGVLFDQADIENWNKQNTAQRTDTYNGHILYLRHSDYNEDAIDDDGNPHPYHDGHTNDALCIRKAKALWVLLARLAGWQG